VGLTNLGSKLEKCVGSRVHLVGVSISIEKSFYRLPFTPPSLVRLIGPSPNLNHILMAEDLAIGNLISLGKYLLGSVYHMLHQTTHLMHTSQKISCVNGPWWFVQMWLQLYMHRIVGIDLNNQYFPSSNYKEGETQITKGFHTYGEAASTISIDQNISQLFELFFKGFTNPL
jgi:hypothetical protein